MQFLTLKQAADLLKVHPNTVRTHALRGTIPAAKVGRDWRFLEEDLVSWVRNRYPEKLRRASQDPGDKVIGQFGGRLDISVPATRARAEQALDALLAKPVRVRSPRRE
jgi:excisionase family DNA binding protein